MMKRIWDNCYGTQRHGNTKIVFDDYIILRELGAAAVLSPRVEITFLVIVIFFLA